MTDSSDFTSLAEAARHNRTTRQAIFTAIRKGALKAEKKLVLNKRGALIEQWIIKRKDLEEYRQNKHNAERRKFEGQRIFSMEDDRFSVNQAAKIISAMLGGEHFPSYKLYYLLRVGKLRGFKRGSAWIIKKEEMLKVYEEQLALQKKLKQRVY